VFACLGDNFPLCFVKLVSIFTLRTTQLYIYFYLIFVDYYYMFRLFQPPSGRNTGSQKDLKGEVSPYQEWVKLVSLSMYCLLK